MFRCCKTRDYSTKSIQKQNYGKTVYSTVLSTWECSSTGVHCTVQYCTVHIRVCRGIRQSQAGLLLYLVLTHWPSDLSSPSAIPHTTTHLDRENCSMTKSLTESQRQVLTRWLYLIGFLVSPSIS